MKKIEDLKIAVIGLGYVGLPLANAFGKFYTTFGYDINEERISELNLNIDSTNELTSKDLEETKVQFTSSSDDIAKCDIYIISVPTPVNKEKEPDMTIILKASEDIGKILSKNNIVIYESTVYPGATEEDCVPILEKVSGLKLNVDFSVGYSPERINPGDKVNKIDSIVKITSASNEKALTVVDSLYNSIVKAGTHKAPNIKVAEAAKVIENTQRDLNIALINELSIIFSKLDIDTNEVLKAAETKWNFIPFKPGLVGGHCIGVDPYYLTHKAESIGYKPEVILAGRKLNDRMGVYIVKKLQQKMLEKNILIKKSKVLLMGFTFKENCPDTRNTKVIDVYNELISCDALVDIYDPICSKSEVKDEYGIDLKHELNDEDYDAIVFCVAHDEFKEFEEIYVKSLCKDPCVIFDLKHLFSASMVDFRL